MYIKKYGKYIDTYIGETLPCSPEDGHLPITISSSCSVLLQMGGAISCRVTGSRCYSQDLDQGGLCIGVSG